MKDTKFTPGPWSVCSDDPNVVVPYPTPAPFRHFTASEFIDCNTNANAHLIAAAPDLYEALEAVIAVADRNTVEFDRAKAALAKARGEA